MFYTYIIYSKSKDKYYIGYTEDLKFRLERHNSGGSRSTNQKQLKESMKSKNEKVENTLRN